MKKTRKIISLLTAITICISMMSSMTTGLVSSEAINLVTNGDFENGASGWSLSNETGFSSTVTDEEAHSGSNSLKISTTNAGWQNVFLNPAVSLTANTTYTFSYWVKGAANHDTSLALRANDGWGEPYAFTSGAVSRQISDGNHLVWTKHSTDIKPLNDVNISISLKVGNNAAMTFYLDDFSIAEKDMSVVDPNPITYGWSTAKIQQQVQIGSNAKMYKWFDGVASGQDNWFEDNGGRVGYFRPKYWVSVDFQKSYDLTNYQVISPGVPVKGYTFYGSNDNSTWVEIAPPVINNTLDTAVGTFDAGTRVRYLKFQITIPKETTDQVNGWINVQEIKIFGNLNPFLYNVTFDSMGGSEVNAYQNIEEDTLLTAPPVPTKSGSTFAGWYLDQDYTSKWEFLSNKLNSDITLYAKWSSEAYDVTFDSTGGSAVLPLDNMAGNELIIEPTAPTWAGCIFDGWYTDMTYATKWNFGTDLLTSNMTLYAKWVPAMSKKIIHGWSQEKIKSSITVGTLGNGNNPGEALNDGWKVFDGNTGSAWVFEENANRDGYWIAIDLGDTYQITSYKITAPAIKGFKFQVSEDGIGGTYADTGVEVTNNPQDNNPIGDCDFTGRYIKFKVTIPNHKTDGNGWLTLNEVELYGIPTLNAVDNKPIKIRNFALINSATRQCINYSGLIDQDMSVIADVTNTSDTDSLEFVMIAGIFEKQTGKLVSIKTVEPESIPAGDTKQVEARISVPDTFENPENYFVKAFFWNDTITLKPITTKGSFAN